MVKFVVENLVKKLISEDIPVKRARVAIFVFTFKEDCPDTRNNRVIDIVTALIEYGIEPYIIDPVSDKEEAKHEYGLEFD
ncbi:nucleotide sugar dehydrogenase, partial [Francisella tularensis subsp. holarctica]|uniref:UDP binding domain-containing protein n=1 Tax=Francisella tularensis TaxID=263 RepID=UPI002381950F